MEYSTLIDPDPRWLPQLAALHHEALSSQSFITSFGQPFLVRLYEDLLLRRLAFVLLAHDGPRALGFILAATDGSRIVPSLALRPQAYARFLLPAMLREPRLILYTLESLAYGHKAAVDVAAELVVIAVDREVRSRAIGQQLLRNLDRELSDRGASSYKVTVHQQMERANHFYLANAMTLRKTFRLRGLDWNTYVREIGIARRI